MAGIKNIARTRKHTCARGARPGHPRALSPYPRPPCVPRSSNMSVLLSSSVCTLFLRGVFLYHIIGSQGKSTFVIRTANACGGGAFIPSGLNFFRSGLRIQFARYSSHESRLARRSGRGYHSNLARFFCNLPARRAGHGSQTSARPRGCALGAIPRRPGGRGAKSCRVAKRTRLYFYDIRKRVIKFINNHGSDRPTSIVRAVFFYRVSTAP